MATLEKISTCFPQIVLDWIRPNQIRSWTRIKTGRRVTNIQKGDVMTTIRATSRSPSSIVSVQNRKNTHPKVFTQVLEVLWQLALEEYPAWSSDQKRTWAEYMANRMIGEHDAPQCG